MQVNSVNVLTFDLAQSDYLNRLLLYIPNVVVVLAVDLVVVIVVVVTGVLEFFVVVGILVVGVAEAVAVSFDVVVVGTVLVVSAIKGMKCIFVLRYLPI